MDAPSVLPPLPRPGPGPRAAAAAAAAPGAAPSTVHLAAAIRHALLPCQGCRASRVKYRTKPRGAVRLEWERAAVAEGGQDSLIRMIACIAVVGKKNELLFLETYVPERDRPRFHFVAHAALDVFEERRLKRPAGAGAAPAPASSGGAADMYLGYLCPIEEFRLYGYQTSTQVKLIAVLNEGEPVREAELKGVFQGIHTLYVSHLHSPFAPLAGKIASDRFHKGVERQVTLYNQSTAPLAPPPPAPPLSASGATLLHSASSLSASISGSLGGGGAGGGGGGPL